MKSVLGTIFLMLACIACDLVSEEEFPVQHANRTVQETPEAALCGLACRSGQSDTRAIERYMPPDDPNLDPNWDWTQDGPGHTLYYTDLSGIIRSTTRQLPFYVSGHALNTIEKDMYQEDGWVLAFRDFGTPDSAPDMPFFVLYNKYRGMLRIMLFNTRELAYSRFKLELSFKSPSASGALFTYSAHEKAALDDYDSSKFEVFLVEANAINGWLYGDFMLTGYDPNLSPLTQLRLHIVGVNVANLSLESDEFTLSEVLRDANPGASNGGSDLVGAVNEGHKYYKNVNGAARSLREAADKNPGKWWSDILKSVVGTPSKPSPLASVASIAGGLIGFIGSFIGGSDDPAPREPLYFEGALKMSGSIIEENPLYSLDLGLTYSAGSNPSDHYRPLRSIRWGIFNLRTQPVVEYTSRRLWDAYYCEAELKEIPAYVFNGQAGLQLVSVKYALTREDAEPTEFSSDPQYGNAGYSLIPCLPKHVAVEVKMRTTSPTRYFDNDIVFYKAYPRTLVRKN
ncbi:MAG: hypothetical protein MJE77_23000 [Proteobacteria bacterium]|nr:hypothetical protein [Pseudomonadota bacterium]